MRNHILSRVLTKPTSYLSSFMKRGEFNAAGAQVLLQEMDSFRCDGREKQSAVCSFLGTLVRSTDAFPYLMLLAFETRCVLRALLLLVTYPFCLLLRLVFSEDLALQVQFFITFCGLEASVIELYSKTVLAKSCFQDFNSITVTAFASFGKKFVVTKLPRIMVEPFLKHYLRVEYVIGPELQVLRSGHFTGLVDSPGLLNRLEALKLLLYKLDLTSFDVGFGNGSLDLPLASLCKEAYVYKYKPSTGTPPPTLPPEGVEPLIFHDGRLAVLPTPAMALAIFLWTPFAVLLVVLRVAASHCPYAYKTPLMALLGIRLRVRGCLPAEYSSRDGREGTLFVCSHRTLLDPLVVSGALKRQITAVTYSISWLSELMSNIKTVRLSRNRSEDGLTMQRLLQTEDVGVCPEGTTCREPYLLRFSPLFAEVSNRIVPVMMYVKTPLFYATTAQGWKWMDPFFFCMNPFPSYEVEFLEELPVEQTCAGGKTSVEVANYIQQKLSERSGYKCTRLTRKDKYMFLTGNQGM